MAELPRFNGTAQVRKRMRLAAAVGLLAVTAIATGGLASLTSGSSGIAREAERDASRHPWATADPAELLDPASRLEYRVREAESAAARARAALESARSYGSVDPVRLDALEHRLEILGESPLDSLRRNYGPPPEPVDEQGRSHVRTIAPDSRNL